MSQPRERTARSAHRAGPGTRPAIVAVITVLVAASIFFVLWVPIFARVTPKVGDFPFFYFYLIAYMPVVGIVMWIVITLQKRAWPGKPPGDPATPGAGSEASR
jgi:ABC-type multidrug transport system permease subunit